MELANPLRLASSDESVFTIQTGWIWTGGASLCQPPGRDGDQPQPGGGGARAGRPRLRGHVPGGHPGQAGQSDAQGARPCCLSTIYHLPSDTKTIQHSFSLAYLGFDCFHFLSTSLPQQNFYQTKP